MFSNLKKKKYSYKKGPSMSKRCLLLSLLSLLIIPHPDEDTCSWSQTFAEMLQVVQSHGYQPLTMGDAMIRAMKGFVSFDPHSSFLDPKSFDEIMQLAQGTFSGIGVVLDARSTHGPYKLVSVLPHKPADKAGLRTGDFILAVNHQSVLDMPYDLFVEQLRGPRNTTVELTAIRGTELLTVSVVRDIIEDEAAIAFIIKTKQPLFYLCLRQFCSTTPKCIKSALDYLKKHDYHQLIIDVRDNGGGLVEATVEAAEYFLPKNSIVAVTKNKNNALLETYKTKQSHPTDSLDIIILVNRTTASAAEIFAGVLSSYAKQQKIPHRVVLIGEKTFGKGSVQEVIPLSNNCALKLTSALYYLPGEVCIQNCGILPDIICEKLALPTEHERTLKQLLGSEKNLPGALKTTHPEEVQKKDIAIARIEQLKHDNQLVFAVNALTLSATMRQLSCLSLIAQLKNLLLHDNTEIVELKL